MRVPMKNTEPVAVAGAIRAIILCAVAFGLKWTADQVAATMLAVEAILTVVTRQSVTANTNVAARIENAKVIVAAEPPG